MLFVMVSMWVARTFGFRHRAVEDDLSVFRVTDVFAGFMLPTITVAAVSAIFQYLIPPPPTWVSNMLGGVALALVIFLGTVWMPFVEHLSLLAPGDVTAPTRRKIVILARAIPYLYGFIAVCMALVFAPLAVMMFGAALVGIAQIAGFDPESVSRTTWLWIGGGATLLLGLFLARAFLMMERLKGDWGLPEWCHFVEAGRRRPAGERLFGPLDATLGRLVLAATAPSAKDREAAAVQAPAHLSDLRRYPGDIFDVMVGMVAGLIVAVVLVSVGSALLSWLAPDRLAALSAPAPARAPGEPATLRPVEMALFMGMAVPTLGTMFGVVMGLSALADRSLNLMWARQQWVRWLARGLEVLRLLSTALLAIVIAIIPAAFLGYWLAPNTPWVTAAIFAVFAFILAPTLLRSRPDKDSYLLTFIANVEAANRPVKETAPHADTGRNS
jgi:hypothetical protein